MKSKFTENCEEATRLMQRHYTVCKCEFCGRIMARGEHGWRSYQYSLQSRVTDERRPVRYYVVCDSCDVVPHISWEDIAALGTEER